MWHHENSCRFASYEVNTKAHTCPECGEEQYTIYYGDTRREFILPQLCGMPREEEKMSVDDYLNALQDSFLPCDDKITPEIVNKLTESELLAYIITGKLPR